MVSGHDFGRLSLCGEPGVEDDESRLDGVGVVQPVPEPDYGSRDEPRSQAIADTETRGRFRNTHQAEQAGRCSGHEAVMWSKPTNSKTGVELPEAEPVGAESRDDVREYHRQRKSKPD